MSNATAHSLIISDLHLSAQRPDLNTAFKQFCESTACKAQALYILGDLADAWVGDDDDSQTAQFITDTLAALSASGTAVYLMTGNRDFLMGEKLAEKCGLTLLTDPTQQTIHGHELLLMHGDSLCTGDAEYMAFRAQIQNPATAALLMSKPLDERRQIAQMLRAKSQSANSNKAEDIMDVTPEEVQLAMQKNHVTTLIHGHTHRPAVHEFNLDDGNAAKRYVLGDWDCEGWMININEKSIELCNFSLEAKNHD
jgi:UDP-2,3-diacylglucosamine hydrolase